MCCTWPTDWFLLSWCDLEVSGCQRPDRTKHWYKSGVNLTRGIGWVVRTWFSKTKGWTIKSQKYDHSAQVDLRWFLPTLRVKEIKRKKKRRTGRKDPETQDVGTRRGFYMTEFWKNGIRRSWYEWVDSTPRGNVGMWRTRLAPALQMTTVGLGWLWLVEVVESGHYTG